MFKHLKWNAKLTLRNSSFIDAYIALHVSGTIAEIADVETRYKKASE